MNPARMENSGSFNKKVRISKRNFKKRLWDKIEFLAKVSIHLKSLQSLIEFLPFHTTTSNHVNAATTSRRSISYPPNQLDAHACKYVQIRIL